MALETGDYISDLVITNPVGATDPKSQGDDHIRLLKKTIKQTFPNLSGAMTLTQGNLNALAPFFTDPNADRIAFWDDSAGAFAFLAPDGTTIAISGTTLSTGSNVPLLNGANTFTSNQLISRATAAEYRATETGGTVTAYLGATATEVYVGARTNHAVGFYQNDTLRGSISTSGVWTLNGVAQTDFARLSQENAFQDAIKVQGSYTDALTGPHIFLDANGGGSLPRIGGITTSGVAYSLQIWGSDLDIFMGGASRLTVSSSGNFDFKGGTVTTNNASAAEVGYKGAPTQASISASANTGTGTAGATVRFTGGSGQTFTLDSDPPADSVVVIDNASGNSWTIAASGTLTWAATGGTGSRTLANGGLAVALHAGSGNWKINGGGLS